MSKQKLTPWFPLTTLPTRRGSYELGFQQWNGGEIAPMAFPFHWFNGKTWTQGDGSCSCEPSKPHSPRKARPFDAAAFYGVNSYWRGLAEQPK
jgi:hypothetical protein